MTNRFTQATVLALAMAGACKHDAKPAGGAAAGSAGPTTAGAPSGGVVLKDPDGDCKPFSDPSITKPPAAGTVFGNGQTLSLEYDGSKSEASSSLFYRTFFFDAEGTLRPISGGPFDGMTKGIFSTNAKVFESNANGRPGCVKVGTVINTKMGSDGMTGTQVPLGTYPIKYDIGQ